LFKSAVDGLLLDCQSGMILELGRQASTAITCSSFSPAAIIVTGLRPLAISGMKTTPLATTEPSRLNKSFRFRRT
jgi:hypothetical protein